MWCFNASCSEEKEVIMVFPLLLRGAAALAARKGGKEVAKRAPTRSEKFMGMVDEVAPKRLADDTVKTGGRSVVNPPTPRGMSAPMKGALIGAGALGAGAALMSGDDEKKGPSAAAKAKGRVRPDETPKAAEKSATRIAFEKEFRRARDRGETTFTFRGETFHSRMAGETKEQHQKRMGKARALVEASKPQPLAKGGKRK